jgi:iron complex transport system substrate-binding protein
MSLSFLAPAGLPAQAQAAWPRSFVDDHGTTIRLAQPPRRIVSVTLATDEILLALVAKGRIAAVTSLAADPSVSNVVGQVLDIPMKLDQINAEVILSLKPDLVFVADWSDASSVKQLRSAGLTVYQIKTPVTVKEIQARIVSIGALVGEEAAARKLNQWMDGRIAAVSAKVAGLAPDKRLVVMDYNTWGSSMGAGSTWADIVRLAGLRNAVGSMAADQYGSVAISKETLLQLNPDILMLPSWVYGDAKGSDSFYDGIMADPALRTMKAIRQGKVHRMPEAMKSATSQYIVLGIEDLAKYAYPELFK